MVLLKGKVQSAEERVCHLNTKDFLRPHLKQIGSSIEDIRSYFEKKGVVYMMSDGTKKNLEYIDSDLLSLLQEHCVFYGDNMVKGACSARRSGACSGTCTDASCLVVLSDSLATTFNISASTRPFRHKCDIVLAMPRQPLMILTVTDDSTATGAGRAYNASVVREVTSKMRAFTSESVNIVHGVICRRDLKDSRAFHRKILLHAALSSLFLPKSSFSMGEHKYSHVLTAFWAAIAQTRSVLAETDTSIRFLTKEQCVVLVENMNSKHVQVRCEPGSGATTLMLEVTRRLSRLGETLLVCRSREDTDRLRPLHPLTVSVYDVGYLDLSKFENIVHDTDDIIYQPRGSHWHFLRESAGTKNRQ